MIAIRTVDSVTGNRSGNIKISNSKYGKLDILHID